MSDSEGNSKSNNSTQVLDVTPNNNNGIRRGSNTSSLGGRQHSRTESNQSTAGGGLKSPATADGGGGGEVYNSGRRGSTNSQASRRRYSKNDAAAAQQAALNQFNTKNKQTVQLSFRAERLDDTDTISKSDPYLVLCKKLREGEDPAAVQAASYVPNAIRVEDPVPFETSRGTFIRIGRTETIKDNLEPVWKRSIPVEYDPSVEEQVFLVYIYDDDGHDDDGKNDMLMECTFTLKEALRCRTSLKCVGKTFAAINAAKAKEGGGTEPQKAGLDSSMVGNKAASIMSSSELAGKSVLWVSAASRRPISFQALRDHDDKLREEEHAKTASEREAFPVEEILQIALLARIVEALRFSLDPKLLDEEVTLDLLRQELHKHQMGSSGSGETIVTDKSALDPKVLEKKIKDIDESLDRVWSSYSACKEKAEEGSEIHKILTFGDFFDYQFPLFPETSDEDRAALKLLGTQRTAISRVDVCNTLKCEPDSQVVEYIYASGADVLSSEVFREIVSSLSVSPRSLSFAPVYFQHMLMSGKRMATLIPDFVTLVLLLVFVSLIASIDSHIAHRAVHEFTADDWANGCPYGETSELGCRFLQRNYETMHLGGWDGLRFARDELINRLWPTEGGTARDEVYGSTHLIGALMVRHVLAKEDEQNFNEANCQAANVSTGIVDVRIGKEYSCNSIYNFEIPFDYTQEEALERASSFINLSLPVEYQNKAFSSALIFEFVSYQRSHGYLIHTRIVLSFPSGGSVIPRMEVNPVDPETQHAVLPMMIVQLFSFFINLALALFYQYHGIPSFGMDFWRALFLFILAVVAVSRLRRAATFLEAQTVQDKLGGAFFQTQYYPPGVDQLAEDYNVGMSLFGFYTLLFIGLLGRFFRDVGGLELVVSVLRKTWIELVSLGFVFMIWAIGFTVSAMTIFGGTVYSFSSFTTASLTLLGYFQGEDNYEDMVANHPVSGPMFYFIYQLFVVFFALNLLIAVLTAPLTSIKAETKIDNDLLEAIEIEMIANNPESTVYDQWYWTIYSKVWLPICNMAWDSRPIGDGKWLRYNLNLQELYPDDPANSTDILKKLKAVEKFHKWFDGTQKKLDSWNSILLKHVVAKKLVRGKVSLALCLAAIAAESRFNSMRDARLLLACTQFSRFFNEIESVEGMQEFLIPIAKEQTSRLATKLKIGATIVDNFMSAVDETTLASIASGKMTIIADEDMHEDEDEAKQRKERLESIQSRATGESTPQNHSLAGNPLGARPAGGGAGGSGEEHLMSISNHPIGHPEHAGVVPDSHPGTPQSPLKKPSSFDQNGNSQSATAVDDPSPTFNGTMPLDSNALAAMDDLPDEAEAAEHDDEEVAQQAEDQDASAPQDAAEAAFSMTSRYHFGDVMDIEFNKAFVTGLYAVFILIFTMWYMEPFLRGENSTAFLSKTLDEGLRDMWMLTKCYDENCSSAWSFKQTWRDVANLGEVQAWVDEVYIPQVFFVDKHDMDERDRVSRNGMWWDPRVERISPITVRQQKAARKSCIDLPTTELDDITTRLFAFSEDCFHGPAGETERNIDWAKSNPAGFYDREPEAYEYSDPTDCVLSNSAVKGPQMYHGFWHVYDCGGFVAHADNYTELRQIFSDDAGWLDNTTRLISIGATFKMDIAKVDYVLLVELGNDGHFAQAHALAFVGDEAGIPTLDLSRTHRVVFQVLICCHMFLYVILYVRYILWLNCWKIDPYDCEKIRPEVPLSLVIVFFLTFIVSYPVFRSGVDLDIAINLCAVVYIQIILTQSVVFPTASLLSKQVKILIDTLSNAALHCMYVMPFLVIFYLCFAYSGMIIFGRSDPNFAHVRAASLTVVLGTFGRWDADQLEEFRPIEAQVFTLLFFIAVLIVLANMFLAMVTSAASDAHQTPPSIQIAENIQAYYGRVPMYGGFVNAFLAANVAWARYKHDNPAITRKLPRWLRKRRSKDPAILTPWGRLWFPCECLVPRLRPLRITRLLRKYQFHDLNHYTYGALIPFILGHFLDFRSKQLVKQAWDEADNANSASAYVRALSTGLIQTRAQEKWAEMRFSGSGAPELSLQSPSFEVPTRSKRSAANRRNSDQSGSAFISSHDGSNTNPPDDTTSVQRMAAAESASRHSSEAPTPSSKQRGPQVTNLLRASPPPAEGEHKRENSDSVSEAASPKTPRSTGLPQSEQNDERKEFKAHNQHKGSKAF